MFNKTAKLLYGASALYALGLLLSQGLVKVVGLVFLFQAIQENWSVSHLVFLYAALIAADLLLQGFSEIAIARWSVSSSRRYVETVCALYQDRPDIFGSPKAAEGFVSATINPGYDLIQGVVEYLSLSLRSVLSTVAGIAGFAAIVGVQIGVLLVVASLGVLCVVAVSVTQVKRQHSKLNLARGRNAGVLVKGFVNLTTGNNFSTFAWYSAWARSYRLFADRSISSIKVATVAHVSTGLIANLPCLAGLAWLIGLGKLDPKTVLLLPRLLEATKSIMDVGSLLTSAGTAAANLKQIETFLQSPDKVDVWARIKWDQLTINGHAVQSDFLDSIPVSGRITIRGKNGSGKSALLMVIKGALGRNATYLPARETLLSSRFSGYESSGESALRMIRTALDDNAQTILLDEWDANLDERTAAIVHQWVEGYIDNGRRIIEVRHRP